MTDPWEKAEPQGERIASPPAALIQIRGLVKSFPGTPPVDVLKGIDLDIAQGETIALIGASGSGKSTLLRCINGLETHDAGTIFVGGERVTRDESILRDIRKRVGMVFQLFNLFAHWSVADNLIRPLVHVYGFAPEAARERALLLLSRVGLADRLDALPDQLSGGMQQRVAIARALAMGPEVMLFDEPTSALDPELVREVLEVIREVARGELAPAGEAAKPLTTIIVTHEIGFAREVATRVAFIDGGRIAEIGPPRQVIDAPREARTRAFLSKLL